MNEAENFLKRLTFHHGKVTVLTGAGVSTPSGIPDFRSPNGIYSKYEPEALFGLEHFLSDPAYFYKFARDYLFTMKNAEPNAVHKLLKELEDRDMILGVITQNIDMLHEKVGMKSLALVHGSMASGHCLSCGKKFTLDEMIKRSNEDENGVVRCDCGGIVKPDIVFFGESLPSREVKKAHNMLENSTLVIAMGTTLVVYPVGSFPEVVLQNGGKLIVVNKGPTRLDFQASEIYEVSLEEFSKDVLRLLK